MSVGTGIFLGLCWLGVLYLYVQTRDRWKWKRIAKVAGIVAAVPIVLGGLWFGYMTFRDHENSKPKAVDVYVGVRLGLSKPEVRYALGRPTEVLEPEDKQVVIEGHVEHFRPDRVVTQLQGQSEFDFDDWQYSRDETDRIDVTFDPKSEVVSWVGCYSRRASGCPELLGIRTGDDEDLVVKALGVPTQSKLEPSGSAKTLTYAKYNVTVRLSERKVYMLIVGKLPD